MTLYSTVYPKKYAHGFCFVVVIHWLIFPYPSGLLHWHCGNLTIAPVPAKQPWWIWINTSCEFIMKDCITTTTQSTTKPCAYFLGYTVRPQIWAHESCFVMFGWGELPTKINYRKTSKIRRTPVGNKIVDHSDVVGASPVGAAPTTSSFST